METIRIRSIYWHLGFKSRHNRNKQNNPEKKRCLILKQRLENRLQNGFWRQISQIWIFWVSSFMEIWWVQNQDLGPQRMFRLHEFSSQKFNSEISDQFTALDAKENSNFWRFSNDRVYSCQSWSANLTNPAVHGPRKWICFYEEQTPLLSLRKRSILSTRDRWDFSTSIVLLYSSKTWRFNHNTWTKFSSTIVRFSQDIH